MLCLGCEYLYCFHLRERLQHLDSGGWCGVISMTMGRSLSFSGALERLQLKQRGDGEKEAEVREDLVCEGGAVGRTWKI